MSTESQVDKQQALSRYKDLHDTCAYCGHDGSFEAYLHENPELLFRFSCTWCHVSRILGLDYPAWVDMRNLEHYQPIYHFEMTNTMVKRKEAIDEFRAKRAERQAKTGRQ